MVYSKYISQFIEYPIAECLKMLKFRQYFLVPSFQQKAPATIQHAYLGYLPAFFVKEIEPVYQAAEIKALAMGIGYKIFLGIGLSVVNPEGTTAVLAIERVEFDVLPGIGRFNFYPFHKNLGRSEEGVRKQGEGECYFFHGG